MIYLIDDKKSRQRDYGWDEAKLAQFSQVLVPIYNAIDFQTHCDNMLDDRNIILFHESFLMCNEQIKSFKEQLSSFPNIYICYFSGSKIMRSVQGNICMLPPDVMYANLEVFIRNAKEGIIDLNYLSFGENYIIEENIRKKLQDVNNKNIDFDKINIQKSIFFVADSNTENEVISPFENAIVKTRYFNDIILDTDLDLVINEWFNKKTYDAIYLPLYIGNVLSDYLGLRLALHIRLTDTLNQQTPIFIYGVSSYEDVCQNECFDVLKLSSTQLIGADSNSLIDALKTLPTLNAAEIDVDKIKINIPSDIGDNHSLANKWAIYRWCDMLDWNGNFPIELDDDFTKSLYFKYLVAKHGKHDRFKKQKKYSIMIEGIKDKNIAYIDDEYNKGWEGILRTLVESNGGHFICFEEFDKKLSKEELLDKIYNFVEQHNEIDCFLLDLRLHEDDFSLSKDLTGHLVSRKIKELNKGNQIIVFTASNKIWNLKEEINQIGASAYILKESPDLKLNRDASKELYIEFVHSLKTACSLSYLKDLVCKQVELCKICATAKQLDSLVNLLILDSAEKNQDLLSAALLISIVFLEDFIENQLRFKLSKNDYRIYYNHDAEVPKLITGHFFFKLEIEDGHGVVKDVSEYYKKPIPCDTGWMDVLDKPLTLIVAILYMEFGLSYEIVKQYITLKYIRNTQIAHRGDRKIELDAQQLVDFYNTIIYPIVQRSAR